jgi:excisionase family DNA binding protein
MLRSDVTQQHEFLTVEEVRGLLRLSRNGVYRLLQLGEIPGAIRVGRTIRVCRRTLLDWLRSNGARELNEQ